MRILPPQLLPWRVALERRHDPPLARGRYGYRSYRQCLRWEFGFTCPFCLCHEADFAPRGAEGLGITQVEHFVPVSDDEEGTNDYLNCFYICQYCNQDRGTAKTINPEDGSRLLNPCSAVWEGHFKVVEDRLRPVDGGDDAEYTHAAYDLDDPRKVEMRRYRRETVEACLTLIERGQPVLERLLDRALDTQDPILIDEAKIIEEAIRRAWLELERFKAIPQDARDSCACQNERLCVAPRALQEQTIEIEPPL